MPRLWIDTNVARSVTDLRALCRLAKKKGVEVVVHPQVYLERRRQERVKQGEQFSVALFDSFLHQQGIKVCDVVLDQTTAGTWADALHQRCPTHEAWEAAKQRTLGGELRADFKVVPGRMPMTTDWLIALAIEPDPASWVITHDAGEEWHHLRGAYPKRALGWQEAIAWLTDLPG